MSKMDLSNYIPVNERLEQFYKDCPKGRVLTELVEHDRETGFVLMKAAIYRTVEDAEPAATGHAFEERASGNNYVNKTSYVENCETSAVGRALALLGYEINRGIASREEMEKVQRHTAPPASGGKPAPPPRTAPPPPRNNVPAPKNGAPSSAQLNCLRKLCQAQGLSEIDVALEYSGNAAELFEQMTAQQAGAAINGLQATDK